MAVLKVLNNCSLCTCPPVSGCHLPGNAIWHWLILTYCCQNDKWVFWGQSMWLIIEQGFSLHYLTDFSYIRLFIIYHWQTQCIEIASKKKKIILQTTRNMHLIRVSYILLHCSIKLNWQIIYTTVGQLVTFKVHRANRTIKNLEQNHFFLFCFGSDLIDSIICLW